MSRAYKCDRCRKLYEGYDQNLNPIKDHTEDYILEVMKIRPYSNAHNMKYDLCPKCYEELAKFMDGYKEKSEE